VKYYFHYTSKAGFSGVAGTCGVKKDGQLYSNRAEDGTWRIMQNQPQKSSWFTDQHAEGFYLTDLSPDDLEADPKRFGKLGLGKLNQAGEMYIFIFRANDKSFAGAEGKGAYPINQYKGTQKFYICAKKIDTDGLIYLSPDDCFWCGPASQWDNIKGMLE
jgi:hypothetical protein